MNNKICKKIIFVCTGNTCRSPMAEAILKSELKRLHIEGVEVRSAGMSVGANSTVNTYSLKMLAEHGLELPNFRSTPLCEGHLDGGVIICMTNRQRDQIVQARIRLYQEGRLTEKENNVYSFAEVAGYEIPDPYGLTLEHYRYVFEKLSQGMSAILDRFCKEAEKPAPKKRGRPKKTQTDSTEQKPKTPRKKSEKTAGEASVPKKRGRPRKNPPKDGANA